MIDEKNEYPELHRYIRLLPKDISLAILPAVAEYMREAEARLQPVIDRAVELWIRDILAYGGTQKTPEEYVREALR